MSRPHKRKSTSSQRIRQLDEIETTLNQLLSSFDAQQAANDPYHSPGRHSRSVEIKRTSESIELSSIEKGNETSLHSIDIKPLFAGSHSQSEVVIAAASQGSGSLNQALAHNEAYCSEREKTGHKTDKLTFIKPLDPALYYTRFSPPDNALSKLIDRESIHLLLALPDNDHSIDQHKIDKLKRFSPVFQMATTITLIARSSTKDNCCASIEETLRNQITENLAVNRADEIEFTLLESQDSVSLFQHLSYHDIALLPSIGLAMDALNSGCASGIWTTSEDSLDELKSFVDSFSNATERRQALRQIAAQQRQQLQQSQLEAHKNHLITTHPQPVAYAIDTLHQYQGSPTPTSNKPIISLHTDQPADTAQAITQSLQKLRRKSMKLFHSPKQFCHDSRWPFLSQLARYLDSNKP
ncbi:MAG: hypothetical protein KTR32_18110 [Granulosicoccus sp.]|nr:hypothetical protein [Granulosicoccus sp.]